MPCGGGRKAQINHGPHDIILGVLPELELDDVVQLRKPHPCGGYEWKVVRLGADIGIVCLKCGRRVLLPRRNLAKRVKKVFPRAGCKSEDENL
jgi:hypothetical protein